jgi:hypothetical protein
MHRVRWSLTLGWLLLISSLFFDPITSVLTDSHSLRSPLHLSATINLDLKHCIQLQGRCIHQDAYPIGTLIWWSIIVPSAIFILLVLGHEFWRRICPLSFLSQIPRALGIQRRRSVINPITGNKEQSLVTIAPQSWLGRNHLYVQFGIFVLGLGARLLIINSNRVALGLFLLGTIAAAITIGYLYAGKSWCQYFCPMAPVQMVYTGPRSLLGSKNYLTPQSAVTQSMCRTIGFEQTQDKSACVGCKAACIDIDAEKSYWVELNKPGRRLVQYGYFGMVVSFYLYYFLYSGNWDYFFSGVWSHEGHELASILAPGFYLWGHSIPIPKVIAVFATFAVMTAITTTLGVTLERVFRLYWYENEQHISAQRAQHIMFTVFTVASFWTFFSYGTRPLINRLPLSLILGFNALLVVVGSIWLFRTLRRRPEQFDRETMAASLRRQLKQIELLDNDVLDGRSIDELSPDELYMLVKIIPNFSQKMRLNAYSGVVLEILKQKEISIAASFEFCESLRRELKLQDADHFTVIESIGQTNPEALNEAIPFQTLLTTDPEDHSIAKTIAKTIIKRVQR